MILAIQPIFVPNDIGLDIQLKSIRSQLDYFKKYPTLKKFVYGGWCKNEDYWKEIEKLVTVKYKFSKNYGKAKVVNTLFKQYNNNEKYLFTYDSDIRFDIDEPDIIIRCLNIANQIEPFGLLSLNQKECNCQLYDHYTESLVINNEVLRWHPGGAGIAGGCLFISTKAWKDVGGYRELGVYDSDDGFFMLDIANNHYFSATAETINIIHPHTPELKEGYYNWKADILHNRRVIGGGNYDDKLIDAERFWNE